MKNTFDAIIVGAGLAGLAAGLVLHRHNKNFLIIEASNRVGGRTLTKQTASGLSVDLGAQWIGPKELHTRIHELIEQFQLTKIKTYKKGKVIYHFEGESHRRPEWFPPLSARSLTELLLVRRKISKITKELDQQGIFNSSVSEQLDRLTLQEWMERNFKSKSARKFYAMFAREGNCLELDELSALDLFWCIQAAGGLPHLKKAEDFWIKEGTQTLANRMAEVLKENILLSSPVKKIEQTDEDVLVLIQEKEIKAKRIIVCVPPNVLPRIMFSPALPNGLLTMIEKVTPSTVIKFQLLFDKPFWRKKGLNGITYSEKGEVQLTIDSSPDDLSKGVLSLLATGNKARSFSKLDNEKRKKKVIQHIESVFGLQLDDIQEFYQHDWLKEEWIQGGYGFHFKPHAISHYGSSLFEPFGRIHWAGTETAAEWRMYMEGAVRSGEKAAHELIKQLLH